MERRNRRKNRGKKSDKNLIDVKESGKNEYYRENIVSTQLENKHKVDDSDEKSKLILSKIFNDLIAKNSSSGSFDLASMVEEDTEDEECIEYVYKPRQYFLQSLCQFCKEHLPKQILCHECKMVSYCSTQHLGEDRPSHEDFCTALKMISFQRGGHVYSSIKGCSSEQYQAIRISTINTCESILGRPLWTFEKEVLLFPRLCFNKDCYEYRSDELEDCSLCKQISYCRDHREQLSESHQTFCKQLKLFERIVTHQAKYGKITPTLPSKVLTNASHSFSSITQVFALLYNKLTDISNLIFYTELTQIASPVVSTWFGLKLAELLSSTDLVLHIIGAEQHFEIDTLEKWEVFLMHLLPNLISLDIVFVGPELNILPEQLVVLQNQRLCKACRQQKKVIKYHFENALYHDYVSTPSYIKPSLICYFNPGLYRSTGYNTTNTWPKTIKSTISARCPVLVTSYTNFESTLDLKSYLRESDRPIEIILPIIVNPFRSQRPERNFVSEDQAPLIYKNYYLFLVK